MLDCRRRGSRASVDEMDRFATRSDRCSCPTETRPPAPRNESSPDQDFGDRAADGVPVAAEAEAVPTRGAIRALAAAIVEVLDRELYRSEILSPKVPAHGAGATR